MPLIFAGPGIRAGQRCPRPAELLDIYPTLIELCGLPPRSDLEGVSLRPQLENSSTARVRPAITTHNQGNHAVRSEHWRYIRYADGTEELYDERTDPNEWTNLVQTVRGDARAVSEVNARLAEHRRWLPRRDVPPVPGSADRVLTYDPDTDMAIWEGQPVRRGDPVPE